LINQLARLATVAALALPLLPAADFLPLETGNTWTYRNRVTGASFTMRVGVPVISGDKVYYSLQGYVRSNLLVRLDEQQNTLVYLDNDTNRERPLLSFTPMQGPWLDAPLRPCEQESQTQERRTAYSGPAGEFRDSLVVRFRSFSCADAGVEVEQFAENIGMLRRVEQSIAGPQQYDLVYARVGKMMMHALPAGLFSVTVDQANGSGQLTAVLRMRLNGAPLKLRFPTSQEYDVVLRDEAGQKLWAWSDGRFFSQADQERLYSGDWMTTVSIPLPPGIANTQPRNYTVHAWLTTDAPARFAATTPVTVPAQ
jgi:hypothetical protein